MSCVTRIHYKQMSVFKGFCWRDDLVLTTGNGSSGGLKHVDVVFFLDKIDLSGGETDVGEHAILAEINEVSKRTANAERFGIHIPGLQCAPKFQACLI